VAVLAPPRAGAVPAALLPSPAAALRAARAATAERLRELAGWVAVPSVSADPARAADVRRSGEVLAALLQGAGATVRSLPVPGAPPLVVGRVPGRGRAPAVLVYGHHDVVAPGPGWTGDPFRPVLRDGRLVGRGTTDDKGQLMAVVAALGAWRAAGGPPGPVWVVSEGAEEVGSPGLAEGLARLAARVRPGTVLVCDTEQAPDGVPSLTLSQRGHLEVSVDVATGGPPVHPGRLGGAVADPSLVLAAVLHRLARELAGDPVPRLPGPPPGFRVRRRTDAEVRAAAPGRAPAGTDLETRVTLHPALSVLSLSAGTGSAAVPARAGARLDVRLPPGVPPGPALGRLRRAAAAAAPPGVRVVLTGGGAGPGVAALPGTGALAAVDAACRATTGRPVRLVRSGGSLPAAALLAGAFGTPPLLLGLGTPGGGAHGPDEHLDVAGWSTAVALLVRVLGHPAAGRSPPDR
jgi:succinyl-diaminopimelate desuccinylase